MASNHASSDARNTSYFGFAEAKGNTVHLALWAVKKPILSTLASVYVKCRLPKEERGGRYSLSLPEGKKATPYFSGKVN